MNPHDKKPMPKKKRDETKHLENETKLMEQRLQLLKSVLHKSTPKLTSNEGGTSGKIWTGSSATTTTETVPKLKTTADLSKFKLRTLKREPDSGKSTEEGIYSEVVRRLLNDTKSVTSNGVLTQTQTQCALICGQCDDKKAAVSCQECNEDYCARCFAQFHMKGALRRHHSLPLSSFTKRASLGKEKPIGEVPGDENVENKYGIISPRGLNMRGCEIQTSPMIEHFTPSITYAERLMLRVHRRNQLPAMSATNTSSRPNSGPEQMEPVNDFQPSSSSWQGPNFTQLHALATSNMRTEDFCIEFQMEDLENTSNSSSTDIRRPTSTEMNIASTSKRTNGKVELSTCKITEGDTTQVGILQDTPVVSEGDFAPGDGDVQKLGITKANPTSWLPAHSQQPFSNKGDLATIELIKQHLNSLTQAEEAIPTDKQTNGYSCPTFQSEME
ncbi:hypothetical protein P879_01449 [Paragonimus westermani]|uniref:B box-type domain-containing protein n=1 Tax=Paragonimus westermani TaxID=34504 RepID=A0A8T0DU44_9TREM|nr:hypothetical protein P879_01449 [Paragonimus westermani]